MPSGAADLQRGKERVHAAAIGGAGAAQGDHLGRMEAVDAAGSGAAGAAFGRARAGAEPAMHPAAPVPHGRLAAASAGAGARPAAGRCQKIAGRRAVPKPAAAVWRQAGSGEAGIVTGHRNLPGPSWLGMQFAECSMLRANTTVVNLFFRLTTNSLQARWRLARPVPAGLATGRVTPRSRCRW